MLIRVRRTQVFPSQAPLRFDLQMMQFDTLQIEISVNCHEHVLNNCLSSYLNGKHAGPTPELKAIGLRTITSAMSLMSFSDEYLGC